MRKCEIIVKPELVANRITIAHDRITLKVLPDTRTVDRYIMMHYANKVAQEIDRQGIRNTLRGRIDVKCWQFSGIRLEDAKRRCHNFDHSGKMRENNNG